MQKTKSKKQEGRLEMQKGLVKEIVVIVAVIFTIQYFGLDPVKLWEGIVSIWNNILGYFS